MLRVKISQEFQMYHKQEGLKNLNILFLSAVNNVNIIPKT